MSTGHPKRIEDITAEWLTRAMRESGVCRESHVAAMDMTSIGAFHAQWWNHQDLTQLTWMPFENLDIHHLFAQNWPEFRHQFYDELAREEIAVGDRLNWQGDRLAALVADVPRTIVHFDYRADNLMFDEQSRTEPVIVLDWQFVQRSMGAFDVARVVGGSVPSEQQAGRHREFVALWHDGLARAGVRGYGLEDAWRDFLKGLLLCLYIPVAFHHMAWPEGERARALVRAMFHRFFRTAVETDACRVLDR